MEDFVKPVGAAIMKVIEWFKRLATDPKSVLDDLKKIFREFVSWLGNQFAKIPGLVQSGLSSASDAVGRFVDKVVNFLQSLPGKALGVIQDFVAKVTELLTFRNVGKAIGVMVGVAITLFVFLASKLLELALTLITGLFTLFGQLAPKIGFAIGFMVGRAIRLMGDFQAKMIGYSARIVGGMIGFFQRLPGRIATLMLRAGLAFVRNLLNMVRWSFENGPRIAAGIINAVQTLPGKIARIMLQTGLRILRSIPKMVSHALAFGQGLVEGVMGVVRGLPGQVWSALNNVIGAFNDMVSVAFNAAKSFAGGLWDGFKKGLFGSPRTKIEYAMEAMGRTVELETNKLQKRTLQLQRLSKIMGSTKFGVGVQDTVATLAASRHAGKVMGQIAIQKQSRGEDKKRPHPGSAPKRVRIVEGQLSLDKSGRAFIRGLAVDAVDDGDDYADTLRRMR
jgi:hypothetical protein